MSSKSQHEVESDIFILKKTTQAHAHVQYTDTLTIVQMPTDAKDEEKGGWQMLGPLNSIQFNTISIGSFKVVRVVHTNK